MKSLHIISRFIPLFAVVSALILIPGIFSLFRFGLLPSVDFTGGTILELRLTEAHKDKFSQQKLGELLGDQGDIHQRQMSGQTLSLRMTTLNIEQKKKIVEEMKKLDPGLVEKRYETVGPVLGKELIVKTGIAIILSVALIGAYLAVRFSSWQYGVTAALATIHDALVLLGIFSLLGHFLHVEVDILFVTALLTVLSFSVHDTIIVFDRIRERLRQKTNASFEEIVDTAALETLNRSLRNSLAIVFMLLTVFLMTSGSLHWFILALLIGTVTGTYSSTCVALPLLLVWEKFKKTR